MYLLKNYSIFFLFFYLLLIKYELFHRDEVMFVSIVISNKFLNITCIYVPTNSVYSILESREGEKKTVEVE